MRSPRVCVPVLRVGQCTVVVCGSAPPGGDQWREVVRHALTPSHAVQQAPETVRHILRLMEMGAYNTNHFFRVDRGFVAQTADVINGRTAALDPFQKVGGTLGGREKAWAGERHVRVGVVMCMQRCMVVVVGWWGGRWGPPCVWHVRPARIALQCSAGLGLGMSLDAAHGGHAACRCGSSSTCFVNCPAHSPSPATAPISPCGAG